MPKFKLDKELKKQSKKITGRKATMQRVAKQKPKPGLEGVSEGRGVEPELEPIASKVRMFGAETGLEILRKKMEELED